LNEYAEALAAFDRYLVEGGGEIQAARRTEVTQYIDSLQPRVATLEIASTPPDGSITVDDTPIEGTTPQKLRVSAGKRRVTVTKDGYFPMTLNVEIAGLETKRVSFDLVDAHPKVVIQPAEGTAPPPVIVQVPVAAPARRSKVSLGVVMGWVGTGLLLSGAVA